MAAVVQRKGRIAMKGVKGMDEAQDQAPQTGAEGGHDDIGKLQVRRLLLVPLEQAGLRRGHGITTDAHAARLERIVTALAYMTAPNLITLASLVASNAQGGYKDSWPPEVAVINWGHSLQAPPLRKHSIMTSWLASIEGPKAQAAGHLVELFRHLRRTLLPPTPYQRRQIEAESDTNRRALARYRERMDADTANVDERAWVAAYLRDRASAEAIVAQGAAHRAEASAA